MMNILAAILIRRALQLVFACIFSMVTAVSVVMAEPLKSSEHHEDERVAYLFPADKGGHYRVAQQHGIIVAMSDLSAPMTWYDANAKCDSLTLRGFTDWALPSRTDLNRLFLAKMLWEDFRVVTIGVLQSLNKIKPGVGAFWMATRIFVTGKSVYTSDP
jgi:hypothetical protein